ncbi:MAG TPA: ion transporter [Myxococcales bacterium]|nr:ion transporter [Myxococcales bacterium]
MHLRERVFQVLEAQEYKGTLAHIVRISIAILIVANVLALVAESHFPDDSPIHRWFELFEAVSVAVFTVEYLLRLWVCTNHPESGGPILGRLRYAFQALPLIDVAAILPFFVGGFDLRAIRALRLFRLMRVLKLGRHSKSLRLLVTVLKNRSADLISTFFVLLILLIVSAVLMFHAEHNAQPDTFSTVSDALWWGVMTLTTGGYGDIAPITIFGKTVAGIIAILGVGMFALPAGIIATGYAETLKPPLVASCPHCGKNIGIV